MRQSYIAAEKAKEAPAANPAKASLGAVLKASKSLKGLRGKSAAQLAGGG